MRVADLCLVFILLTLVFILQLWSGSGRNAKHAASNPPPGVSGRHHIGGTMTSTSTSQIQSLQDELERIRKLADMMERMIQQQQQQTTNSTPSVPTILAPGLAGSLPYISSQATPYYVAPSPIGVVDSTRTVNPSYATNDSMSSLPMVRSGLTSHVGNNISEK